MADTKKTKRLHISMAYIFVGDTGIDIPVELLEGKTEEEQLEIACEYAQEHILDYYDELNDSQKEALLKQIDETDFSVTSKVIDDKAEDKRGVITPIKAMTLTEINASKEHFKSLGLEAIRAGKVSAVLLAGGNKTWFGQPKRYV